MNFTLVMLFMPWLIPFVGCLFCVSVLDDVIMVFDNLILVFAFGSPTDIQIESDRSDNNDKLKNILDNLSRGYNLQ